MFKSNVDGMDRISFLVFIYLLVIVFLGKRVSIMGNVGWVV